MADAKEVKTTDLRALKNIPLSLVWSDKDSKDGAPLEGNPGFHPAARIEKGDDFACPAVNAARIKKLGYAK